jgi:peptide chain release factor subunit 3
MGQVVMGKLETGRLTKGKKLILMPNQKKVKVAGIEFEDVPVRSASAGQNLKVKSISNYFLLFFYIFRSV